jgi:hypothetical protein
MIHITTRTSRFDTRIVDSGSEAFTGDLFPVDRGCEHGARRRRFRADGTVRPRVAALISATGTANSLTYIPHLTASVHLSLSSWNDTSLSMRRLTRKMSRCRMGSWHFAKKLALRAIEHTTWDSD